MGKRGASCLDGAKEELRTSLGHFSAMPRESDRIQRPAQFGKMRTTSERNICARSRPLARCASAAVLRGSKCNGSGRRTSSERARAALQCFPLFANAKPQRSERRRRRLRLSLSAFKALSLCPTDRQTAMPKRRRRGEEVRSLSPSLRLSLCCCRAAGGITCSHSG